MVLICVSSIDALLYMCALHCACVKSTFPHTMPSQIAPIKHVLNMFLFLNQNLWVVYVCCLHFCPVLMLHFYWLSVLKKVSYRQYRRLNTQYCIERKYLVSPTPNSQTSSAQEGALGNSTARHSFEAHTTSDESFPKIIWINSINPDASVNASQSSFYTALGCISLVGFMSTWYSQPSYWYS